MTYLQLTALLAIANTKDRTAIEPADFFGIEGEVKAIKDNPISGLQDVLKLRCGFEWDGKSPLWGEAISECREQCAVDRAMANFRVDKMHFEDALKVVNYDRIVPHTLSREVVEAATACVAKGLKKPESGE